MSEIAGPGASRATSSQEAYADLVVAHSPALLRLAVMLAGSVPDAEIAALLDCREATVRSHAFRGLAALRARLAGAPRPEEEP